MKIGIEEEFIVVDPHSLFCTPGAFRLATGMVYSDFSKVHSCSVELPLSSRSVHHILTNLKKAFNIFEIKTDATADIDLLREQLRSLRKIVSEIAIDNQLMIIPTGLHPLYSESNGIRDNCAALQVHVDYDKKVFDQLQAMIPFLISISVNSPFIDGKKKDLSNRLSCSPHIGIPTNSGSRSADLIHNKVLDTVEVRVCDTQITVDESIGIASIIQFLSEQNRLGKKRNKKVYETQRKQAARSGFNSNFISEETIDVLRSYNKYAKKKLEKSTGADWQIEIREKENLASVITSLWESFKQDKRILQSVDKEILLDEVRGKDLWYFVSYSPFFFVDKARKCLRDKSSTLKLIKSLIK